MATEQAQEQAYITEAWTEALLSRSQILADDGTPDNQTVHGQTEVVTSVDASDESTPLLSPDDHVRKRQPYLSRGISFAKSIEAPWSGSDPTNSLPWYKTPSVWWLLPAFLPYCIAFGGMMVPKTYLELALLCRRYLSEQAAKDPSFTYIPPSLGADNQQCRLPEVQQLVTYFNTYGNLIAGIFSAGVTPYLGALSDRVGRTKVLGFSSMGIFITEIITIIVGRNPDTVSVYWLLLGFLADGLSGSFTAVLALAMSYAADSTDPAQRAVKFGYFYGALFIGIAIGPLITSALIKATGNMLIPFYMGIGCHVFYCLFILFVVPESLSEEKQMKARQKYADETAALAKQSWKEWIWNVNIIRPLRVFVPRGEGTSVALRRNLLVLSSIDFLMFGVLMGTMSILMVYPQYKFGWTIQDTSYFYSVNNIIRVMSLLLILPFLIRVFRGRQKDQVSQHHGADKVDLGLIKVALVFDFLGYLGYALAPTGAFMYLAGITAAIGGVGSPVITSSLSKHVPPSMTGQLLGAVGLLHACGRVVAPILFSLIYARTVATLPGLVFLCLASLWVAAFILSWLLKPNVYWNDHYAVDQTTPQDRVEGEESR